MANIKFRKGHCYRIKCNWLKCEAVAIYEGREQGYECMVCGKGSNAHGFNVYQGDNPNPTKDEVQDYISNVGYETWFYGTEHLPEIVAEIF